MKSLRLYLITAGILLAVYIIAQVNRPKAINWAETLSSKDKTPFGTYILSERIKDIFPGTSILTFKQPVYNVIAEDSIKNSSYIIISPGLELSKPDYTQLEKYIKQGNNVFIASDYLGRLFEKNLKVKIASDFKFAVKGVQIRFLNTSLNPQKKYVVDKGAGNSYFSKFDTLNAVVIGENADHKANFIRYQFGKGFLYLCANPKYFSNYSLLKPDGAEYSAKALSYIKNTKQIVIDQYYTQGDGGDESPMRLFLSNPTLQWAYYITIFSLLIYVIYEIKRRQRIIPVIKPLKNTTLEFVTVVGQVYYEKRNNANIAHKKVLYFLTYLRDEYQLKTNKLDGEFIKTLAAKVGIDSSFASGLISLILYINGQSQVTDNELIELNKLIEQFYIQSR